MIFRKKRKLEPRVEETRKYQNPYFHKEEKPTIERRIQKDWWVYLAIIVIFVLIIIFLLFRSSWFGIKEINITNTENINTQQIEEIVNNYLNNKKLLFFNNNNYWLLSTSKLVDYVKSQLESQISIKELTIDKSWPGKININAKEKIPNLSWATNDKKYYIDLEGYISQIIENEDDATKLPKVVDQNNLSVSVGDQIISKSLVDFIITLVEEFGQKIEMGDLKIDYFMIPEISCQKKVVTPTETERNSDLSTEDVSELETKKREIQEKFKNGDISIDESLELLEDLRQEYINNEDSNIDEENIKIEYEEIFEDFPCDYKKTVKDIEIMTNEGWRIYLTQIMDLDKQLFNLNLVLREKITNRTNLQYIDLRFDNRVYFK